MSRQSFSGQCQIGDRVIVDPGGDWGRSRGKVFDLLPDECVHVRLDSGGTIIVQASICWNEATE